MPPTQPGAATTAETRLSSPFLYLPPALTRSLAQSNAPSLIFRAHYRRGTGGIPCLALTGRSPQERRHLIPLAKRELDAGVLDRQPGLGKHSSSAERAAWAGPPLAAYRLICLNLPTGL
jgi:hypothetical protein